MMLDYTGLPVAHVEPTLHSSKLCGDPQTHKCPLSLGCYKFLGAFLLQGPRTEILSFPKRHCTDCSQTVLIKLSVEAVRDEEGRHSKMNRGG